MSIPIFFPTFSEEERWKKGEKGERQTPTANPTVPLIKAFISDTQQQTCNIRDAACRYLGPCAGPTIYCRLIATRNAFIISECVHEPRGERKSHRCWDGILLLLLLLLGGWFLRDERYASRCRGSFRARPIPNGTQWGNSGNNAARDMRGLGRGWPPIRGGLLAEFQQRERERRAEKGRRWNSRNADKGKI